MSREFDGQVALVTGANRGIGEAIALDLAAHGAWVAGTATLLEGVAKINQTFDENQLAGMGFRLNLGQPELFQPVVDEVVERAAGPVSILVNNAGINRDQLALRMTHEEWDEVIAVDLTGPFKLTQMVLRGMLRAKHGNVINIGSVVGTVGEAGQANYAAAKAGLVGLTKSLAKEYGHKGLRFNVVAPGYVDTDMTRALPQERIDAMLKMIPLGRALTPQEIAEKVRETLLDESKNGEVVAIDGGLTFTGGEES